jgi:hypothetical protein
VGEPYINEADLPKFEQAYNHGGKAGLIEAIPNSYVAGLTASGAPGDVMDKVEKYRAAGVRLPLLRPAALYQTQRLLDLFATK